MINISFVVNYQIVETENQYIPHFTVSFNYTVVHEETRPFAKSDYSFYQVKSFADPYRDSLKLYFEHYRNFIYDNGYKNLYFEMHGDSIINPQNMNLKDGTELGSYISRDKTLDNGSIVETFNFQFKSITFRYSIIDAYYYTYPVTSSSLLLKLSISKVPIINSPDANLLRKFTCFVMYSLIVSDVSKIKTTCCILACCEPDKYILI